jgi:hypothetical protein
VINHHLNIFQNLLNKLKDENEFSILIVGCKCDIVDERVIPIQDELKFSNDNKLPYVETSSKVNLNVDNCFLEIVKEIDKYRKIEESNKNKKY